MLSYNTRARNPKGGYHANVAVWLESASNDWPVEIVTPFATLPDLMPNSAAITTTTTVSLRCAAADATMVKAALAAMQHVYVSSDELFQFNLAPVAVDQVTDDAWISNDVHPNSVTIDFQGSPPLLSTLQPGQMLIENPSIYVLQRIAPAGLFAQALRLAEVVSSAYAAPFQDGQFRSVKMVEFVSLTPISGGVRLTGIPRGMTSVLKAGTFIGTQLDAYDRPMRDPYNPPVGNGFWSAIEADRRNGALTEANAIGPRNGSLADLLGLFNLHYAFNNIPVTRGITLDGELLMRGMDVAIDMKWRDAAIKKLAFTFSARADLTMRLTAEAGSKNDGDPLVQKEKQIVYAPLPPVVIPIGDVGLQITPQLTAKIGASLDAQARLVVPMQTQIHAGCTMTWDDSKPEGQKFEYTPIQESQPISMSDPMISTAINGHASAWAEASFQVMLGITTNGFPVVADIIGPKVTARVQGDFNVAPLDTPWWTINGSANIEAKMRFAFLGFTIADPTFGSFALPNLFERHATTPPDAVNGPLDNAAGGHARWARAVKWGVGGPASASIARVAGTAEDVFITFRTQIDNSVLLRVNGKGDLVWSKGGLIFSPEMLASTPDGGCIVGGTLFGTLVLSKYDGAGNLVWTRDRRLTDAGNAFHSSYPARVLVRDLGGGDHEIFMVGAHDNNLNTLDSDPWILKYDASGTLLWAKHYPTADGEYVSDAALLPNGNLVLSGAHKPSPDTTEPPGPGAADGGWLMIVNPNGEVRRVARTAAALGMGWRGVTTGPDGSIYTTGYLFTTVFYSLPTLQVAKYDSDLRLQAIVTIGEGNINGAEAIAETPDHRAMSVPTLTGDPLHPDVILFGLQDYLPDAGATNYDNGQRIRWTPAGVVVIGTTAQSTSTAAYTMTLTEELGVRWMNAHERFNSAEFLMDVCATDNGIVCVGNSSHYFEASTHNGTADNGCGLILKLPFDGRIELHANAHGMDKYLQPIIHDTVGSEEMPEIVGPDLKYQGTTPLTPPASAEQITTFGNAQPALTNVPFTGWIPLERGNPNTPMTFAQWAAYQGIAGATMSDDFDGDGRSNGQEWFFGGDPFTNQFGSPPFSMTRTPGGNLAFSFTKTHASVLHLPRLDSSTDLLNWSAVTLPSLTVTPLDSYTDEVSFVLPITSEVRRFYRASAP